MDDNHSQFTVINSVILNIPAPKISTTVNINPKVGFNSNLSSNPVILNILTPSIISNENTIKNLIETKYQQSTITNSAALNTMNSVMVVNHDIISNVDNDKLNSNILPNSIILDPIRTSNNMIVLTKANYITSNHEHHLNNNENCSNNHRPCCPSFNCTKNLSNLTIDIDNKIILNDAKTSESQHPLTIPNGSNLNTTITTCISPGIYAQTPIINIPNNDQPVINKLNINLNIITMNNNESTLSKVIPIICDGKSCGQGVRVHHTNKYICPHNNLLYLFGDLCKEWDYERNNSKPYEFLPGSHKKVWWKCAINPCGCHFYEASINHRTDKNRPTGCRFCNKGTPCIHNNLAVTDEKLCEEWDSDKNQIPPTKYTRGSGVKVWWKCLINQCGCHFWEAKIYYRTIDDTGCPFCFKSRPCKHNNLLVTHYELCKEWDYEKNTTKPENYTQGSDMKVWWKCSHFPCKCHSWPACIVARTNLGSGCPLCFNSKPCPHNNLLITHRSLCQQWDYERNKLGPENYTCHSSEKVWWKCLHSSCGCHIWPSTICNRTMKGLDCPFCFSGSPCKHRNLATDNPALVAEWDFIKNYKTPEDYAPQSNYCVWWICSVNPTHSWDAIISCRNRKDKPGSGCPLCPNKCYSKVQIAWLNKIMNEININIVHAENGSEFYIPTIGHVDGYCHETKTVYEFHGTFYHGHPSKYNPNEINPVSKKTYGELYRKTLERDEKIRSLGYNLITMWEHEYQLSKQKKI